MSATVLLVGSGGREHALAWKLAQSPRVSRLMATPGSDALARLARCVPTEGDDEVVELARREGVDLVVIGPEAPLVAGLADRLRDVGLAVFGPGREAARLEGDKAFAKDFLVEAGIPTARSRTFRDLEPAVEHVRDLGGPCVVKATGLAAGKGVLLCADPREAETALRQCLQEGAFGDAGSAVLVEEMLEGPELSVFVLLDGERMAWFAPSRDHKRIGEGDTGPNTGGMGAYTPVADADDTLMERVVEEVLEPTRRHLVQRGLDYRGLLYVGLMLTAEGPKVLEFNCRFGDPETQVVLPTYDGDLHALLDGAARGALGVEGALPRSKAAVGVVLASAGYPKGSTKGIEIPALSRLSEDDLVFHAGTREEDGRWRTNGGRVLCAVGLDEDLPRARARALDLSERLLFEGAQRRRDIGEKE